MVIIKGYYIGLLYRVIRVIRVLPVGENLTHFVLATKGVVLLLKSALLVPTHMYTHIYINMLLRVKYTLAKRYIGNINIYLSH